MSAQTHTLPANITLLPAATKPARRRRDERGMTTAEYAVGTIAAASFAGILIKIITDPAFQALLWQLIQTILQHFLQVP